MAKNIIYIMIEEDDIFPDRYQIISQVGNFHRCAESIEGENSFSSIEEALKFLPEIVRQIKGSNPNVNIIIRGLKPLRSLKNES